MNCITDVKDKISKLIIKAYQHKASDLYEKTCILISEIV